MDLEVVVPEQYLGDVIGDLTSHRGDIQGVNTRSDAQVIASQIPLSETFGYATRLRSLTQGRAVSPCSSQSTRGFRSRSARKS